MERAFDIFKEAVPHLNILLLLGMALFGGTIGGRLFQKMHIPQVVGYMVIGILLGVSGLKVIGEHAIKALQPFNYFALSLIGFTIGGELKKSVLARYGRQFVVLLFLEGAMAFVCVSIFVGVVGTVLFGNARLAWSLGLLLGAISSATAPAATTEVLRAYRTRGPLTRIVLGIVALDDGLALLLFAVASSLAGSLLGNRHEGALRIFIHPLYEIGMSVLLGGVGGFILSRLLKKYSERERLLAFCVGAVFFVCGLALAVHADMLLAAMMLGVIITNTVSERGKDIFKLFEGFTPPIYVFFFVLVGAKLNVKFVSLSVLLIGIVYLAARSLGKMAGARWGAKISGAPLSVRRNLPLCLFSQAGVAIGLSILASQYFPGAVGQMIVIIITATVFVLEIAGPHLVTIAVQRAGEVGLDITEEDYLNCVKVGETVNEKAGGIGEGMSLDRILRLFSDTVNLYYPVVDVQNRLTGVISVDGIKDTMAVTGLGGLIVAADIKEPVIATVSPEATLFEARSIMREHALDYLPVVAADGRLCGMIERRQFNKQIAAHIMDLQRQADRLERSGK